MNVFDTEKLTERMKQIESNPPFQPDRFEMRYTCTQLFDTGVEVTLYFVLRKGECIYYNAEERKVQL